MNQSTTAFRRGLRQVKRHCQAGQLEKALEAVQKLLQEWPGNASLWILLGDLIQLQETGNAPPLDDARAAYQKATELDADSPRPWIELAYFLYAVENDAASAARAFDKALGLCQLSLQEALMGKAKTLLESGTEREGLACLGELLRLLPNGKGRTMLGVTALLEEWLGKPGKKPKEIAS